MPGRVYSSNTYRYGFNDQEKDDEFKGQDGSLAFVYRVQDPRLARFLSIDPLRSKFPELSTYQFASNTPIASKDIEGLESDAWGWLGYSGFHPYATPDQQRQEMQTGWAVLKECFTTKKGLKTTLTGTAEMMRGVMAGAVLMAATELVTGGLGSATIAEELAPRIVTSTTRAMETTSAEDAVIISRMKPSEITPAEPQITVPAQNLTSSSKNPYIGKSEEELLKSKAAYEKLIEEHQNKLSNFVKDPIGNSSPEWIKVATADNPTPQELLSRALGRVKELQSQINKQTGELKKSTKH